VANTFLYKNLGYLQYERTFFFLSAPINFLKFSVFGPLINWPSASSKIYNNRFISLAIFGSLPPRFAIIGNYAFSFSATVELISKAFSIALQLLIENSRKIKFIYDLFGLSKKLVTVSVAHWLNSGSMYKTSTTLMSADAYLSKLGSD
jgi:hypothetical protein